MITADQLVLHAVGDYVLQSDWMAGEKTKKSVAALVHVVTYTLPFLVLTTSWKALLFIAGTHFLIDRWRLARYICYLKNFMGAGVLVTTPAETAATRIEWALNHRWSDCEATGYHKDRPPWMAVWLMIIADNVLHVICNGLALRWWP